MIRVNDIFEILKFNVNANILTYYTDIFSCTLSSKKTRQNPTILY